MRDLMISKLQEINQHETVTRLYYIHNDKRDFVEDFIPFANENYMSDELRDALSKGKTLTEQQQSELDSYVIEKELVLN